MKRTITIICSLMLFSCAAISAQEKGRVSASLESTNHFYVDDKGNDFLKENLPQLKDGNSFGSNDYLKVDYYKGRLSAGIQMEGYFPRLVGYPGNLEKMTLSNLYASWADKSYSVTVGTFYDQFGSGLLFRSWEDRTLGLNNAMVGARATYSFKDYASVKVLWGIPRLGTGTGDDGFFGFGLSKVNVTGADLSISLSEIFGMENSTLALEGSVMNKHESVEDKYIELGYLPNTVGWSGRINFEQNGFFAKGEYVDAGRTVKIAGTDPAVMNAQLLEFGYNGNGLGISVTGRRMENMLQKITSYENLGLGLFDKPKENYPNNMLSYRPAMTTQYTYMLTTLHPYSPEIGDQIYPGEIGGQIDAFYNFRRGSRIGGKRGMRVHANFSTYYSLKNLGESESTMLFRDFSIDVERQWTRKFKTTFLYSMQDYNKTSIESGRYIGLSHIIVADMLYKFTPKFSTRMELQYLTTRNDRKDWMAGLIEVNFAPHWSVFASDMFNHGDTKKHYYNAGVSFAMNHLRVAAGYGRYRAGFICSGGVCREIPQYTGANFSLTASF